MPTLRTRVSLLALLTAGCVALASCGRASTTTTSAAGDATTTGQAPTASVTEQGAATSLPPADAPDEVPANAAKATVARIVDGDTLELAAVAAGAVLGSTQQVDVRLLEIDTPETVHPTEPVQCYGAEASERLTELAPPGSTVWLQRDQELRDQYGRYLLYMWTDQGTFVNLAMVADGYAAATLYEPNDKHWPAISAAEADAKASGAGLWSACPSFGAPLETPEPTPEPQPQPQHDADDGGAAYLFPPPPPDKDCGSIAASNFPVRPGDPHRFDGDGDGIGCEGSLRNVPRMTHTSFDRS